MGKHDKGRHDKKTFEVTEKDERKKFARKKWIIFLSILSAIYIGGVVLFHYVFVPNTTFDGYGFSFKTPKDIDLMMADDTKNRVITLQKIDGEESIYLHEEIDYVKSASPPVGGWINNVTAWKWPIYIFMQNNLGGNVKVEYDESKLDAAIKRLDAMQPKNIKAPKDAALVRDGDVYVIEPEDDGNTIIMDKFIPLLKNTITTSEEFINLDEEGCYEKAKIRRDDASLKEEYERYKTINFQRISLDMGGIEEVLETPDILEKFYDEGELSEQMLEDYIDDLKNRFDTYERGRLFKNSYGDWISVGTIADTYGFRIEAESTKEMLWELLETKESKDTEPVWRNKGITREEGGNDIGDTYIEVSIENQTLWAYIDGEQVIETRTVTGRNGKYATPRGVFSILQKLTDTHLKGEDEETGEEWDSEVRYWMALTWKGVGLHDADWRSSFGGTIYMADGSHGCVNLPPSSAEFLYYNYDYGTPVVIW